MTVDEQIRAARDDLARQGVDVTTRLEGERLCVHVVATDHSAPATWCMVLGAFFEAFRAEVVIDGYAGT